MGKGSFEESQSQQKYGWTQGARGGSEARRGYISQAAFPAWCRGLDTTASPGPSRPTNQSTKTMFSDTLRMFARFARRF